MPKPTVACHDGSKILFTASHTGIISPTSASHVGDKSTTSTSHVEDQQPTTACHARGTTLVTASHTAQTSPTFVSHVGDSSPTYASHVGDRSTTFAIHVEDQILAPPSHARSMSPTTISQAGGIHTIEKHRCIGSNPKFLCIIFKRGHLTHLFPANVMVQEVRSLSDGPLGFDSSLVSQKSNPSLVDTTVMLMQSLTDTTPILESDASLDHVVSYPIQPMVEKMLVLLQFLVDPTLLLESEKFKEVTLLMQYLVNPTLILEGDVSFDHILNIFSSVTFEQGSIPLSPSMPPSPRMVSFDWNDLVDPRLLSSTPF
jgi:hypothetical protein